MRRPDLSMDDIRDHAAAGEVDYEARFGHVCLIDYSDSVRAILHSLLVPDHIHICSARGSRGALFQEYSILREHTRL